MMIHDQESCTRNFCKYLEHVSYFLAQVLHVLTSFLQLCSTQESCMQLKKRTRMRPNCEVWLVGCCFGRCHLYHHCQPCQLWICNKFWMWETCASFLYKTIERVSSNRTFISIKVCHRLSVTINLFCSRNWMYSVTEWIHHLLFLCYVSAIC